ncbi:BQ2448_1651 [Microbotryum intermedium]|uniref:BQ2448_1651 protein n=1 Tax=Microbotryum intermedium TaxID=269621 RepID=A0A238FAQ8_9BASI|nr:BQ2448_1651 [Microbotryum intermedium]
MRPPLPNSTSNADTPVGPNYTLKYTLKGHTKPISVVQFSPDGKALATASKSHTNHTGCKTKTVIPLFFKIPSSPPSSGSDTTIHLHRLPHFSLVRTLESHTSGISHLSFSFDSRYLASTSDDKTIRIWDLTSPFSSETPALVGKRALEDSKEQSQRVLHGHLSAVFCVAWNPRGDLVASGGMDETVRVWDVQKGTCMKVLPAHSDPVSSVQFNRDGTIIVSCSWDGYIRIWDTATGQCLKTLVNDDNTPVSHVSFTPNAKFIFTSTLDSQIRLWDYQNDLTLKNYSGHVNRKYCIPMILDSTGRYIITGSEDHRVLIWDLQTRKVVQTWEAHQDVVICVASHPKLKMLASAGLEKDPTIKIWVDEELILEETTDEEEEGQEEGGDEEDDYEEDEDERDTELVTPPPPKIQETRV